MFLCAYIENLCKRFNFKEGHKFSLRVVNYKHRDDVEHVTNVVCLESVLVEIRHRNELLNSIVVDNLIYRTI
jgi:hypothetical protein